MKSHCWVSCVVFGFSLSIYGSFGFSGNDLCIYVENNYGCETSPCPCDGSDANCETCNAGHGCSKCIEDSNNFWTPQNKGLKCVECGLIDNCISCSDNHGCKECDSSECTLKFNDCGIKYCDCPDMGTPVPTQSPTVDLFGEIEKLRGAYDDFWRSNNGSILDEMSQFFDPLAEVCWGGFDCSDLSTFFNNFAGLCDGGTISTFSDLVFQDLRVIYSFYRACVNENRNLGLFWINGVGITKYTENGKLLEQTVNFRDLDTLLPILDAYAGY